MSAELFDALLTELAKCSSQVTAREDGVAFFRAAKTLYGVGRLSYCCLNIPVPARRKCYAHCVYSDASVMNCMTEAAVGIAIFEAAGLSSSIHCEPQQWPEDEAEDDQGDCERSRTLTFPLRRQAGESAVFAATAEMTQSTWKEKQKLLLRELGILANYFHGHVLRMNGYDSERELLVTAKELDCLKWTAMGKTAWEASVILGISERTVRFHLNMAREKMNCATTTQAVAKAIANQLIEM